MDSHLLRLLGAIEQELSFMETHERTNKRLANETAAHKDMHDYFRGKEDAYGYCIQAIRRAMDTSATQ